MPSVYRKQTVSHVTYQLVKSELVKSNRPTTAFRWRQRMPLAFHIPASFKIHFQSLIHSFIRSFIHSFIHSFVHSFIRSFIHSFIHSFVHSFIRSFIHMFIHSFVHSFIHSTLLFPQAFTLNLTGLLVKFYYRHVR